MAEVNLKLSEDAPDTEYLRACARIRNISLTSLIKRLVDTIADGQLVASVLDDDATTARRKGEHPYRNPSMPRLSGPER